MVNGYEIRVSNVLSVCEICEGMKYFGGMILASSSRNAGFRLAPGNSRSCLGEVLGISDLN